MILLRDPSHLCAAVDALLDRMSFGGACHFVGLGDSSLLAGLLASRLGAVSGTGFGALKAVEPHGDLVVALDVTSASLDLVALRAALARLRWKGTRIVAAFSVGSAGANLDGYGEQLAAPPLLTWAPLAHPEVGQFCIDIDGVLCRDPTSLENGHPRKYREFLRETRPRLRPGRRLGWLVSNRRACFRAETEAWLRRQDIAYRHLHLLPEPGPSSSGPEGRERHIANKAGAFLASGAKLFIESDDWQAEGIAWRTGLPVFCTGLGRLVEPGSAAGRLRRALESLEPAPRLARVLEGLKRA